MASNWIVRCNPTEFRLDRWRADGHQIKDIDCWFISHRFADINEGDRIVWWVSGPKTGGGFGFGQVTDVFEDYGDQTYWNRPAVTTNLQHFVGFELHVDASSSPVRWSQLKSDPVLQRSLFVRRNGRNPEEFTDEEWKALVALLPAQLKKGVPTALMA